MVKELPNLHFICGVILSGAGVTLLASNLVRMCVLCPGLCCCETFSSIANQEIISMLYGRTESASLDLVEDNFESDDKLLSPSQTDKVAQEALDPDNRNDVKVVAASPINKKDLSHPTSDIKVICSSEEMAVKPSKELDHLSSQIQEVEKFKEQLMKVTRRLDRRDRENTAYGVKTSTMYVESPGSPTPLQFSGGYQSFFAEAGTSATTAFVPNSLEVANIASLAAQSVNLPNTSKVAGSIPIPPPPPPPPPPMPSEIRRKLNGSNTSMSEYNSITSNNSSALDSSGSSDHKDADKVSFVLQTTSDSSIRYWDGGYPSAPQGGNKSSPEITEDDDSLSFAKSASSDHSLKTAAYHSDYSKRPPVRYEGNLSHCQALVQAQEADINYANFEAGEYPSPKMSSLESSGDSSTMTVLTVDSGFLNATRGRL